MSIKVGIDIGLSATKMAITDNDEVIRFACFENCSSKKEIEQNLNSLLILQNIDKKDVCKIAVTGVGASFIDEILSIKTQRVDEFYALAKGACYFSKLKKFTALSMGTGTAIVFVNGEEITHLGGSGVGGGTLMGLSKLLLDIDDFDELISLSKTGDLSKIDIFLDNKNENKNTKLPQDLIASNFGNVLKSQDIKKQDIAIGIVNMVFQTIGRVSAFATKSARTNEIVAVGSLSKTPQAQQILKQIGNTYGVNFNFYKDTKYAVALGAII